MGKEKSDRGPDEFESRLVSIDRARLTVALPLALIGCRHTHLALCSLHVLYRMDDMICVSRGAKLAYISRGDHGQDAV